MNIHPFLVHFPIALFTLYTLFELIRFRVVIRQAYWFYVKGTLVIVGAAAAFLTIPTGEIAEKLLEDKPELLPLIETHAMFAGATTVLLSLIALGYVVAWVNTNALFDFSKCPTLAKGWRLLTRLQKCLGKPWVAIILAMIGLVLVLFTGALGSAIIHGVDSDIFVATIYNLLF